MLLEELPEERLIGEVQLLCDFLDALRGVAQQDANLQRDEIIDPVVGCAAAHLLDDFRKVLRRDAQLLRIPADTPLMPEVQLHKLQELGEDGLAASLPTVNGVLHAEDDVAQVVNHRGEQRAHGFTTEVMLQVVGLLLQHAEIVDDVIAFLLREVADGVGTGEEEERRQLMNVLHDFVEEVVAHDDAHAVKIAPEMDKDKIIVVTISGRGDKDCAAIARYRGVEIYE